MSQHEERRGLRRRRCLLALVLVALAGLALAWAFTPMREWLDVDRVVSALQNFGAAFGPVAALFGFAVALTLAIPLSFLTLVALVAYGPLAGFACAVGAALMSAGASYGIGAVLGREVVRRLGGERVNRISRKLASRGLFAVVAVRMVPVAPFAVINMVAGASAIRLRDLLLGTLIGISPGTLAMTLFVDQITAALKNPSALTIGLAAAALALIFGLAWALQRWLRRHADA